MILLDTNFLIHALKPSTSQSRSLRQWIADGQDVGISMVAWAEFLCGPVSGDDRDSAIELLIAPEPLLAEDAARGAELFNATGRRRGSLGDCLIAATCLRVGASLATDDVDDFRRFEPMALRLMSTEF
jgi:predicted nucleic acid-binding protein